MDGHNDSLDVNSPAYIACMSNAVLAVALAMPCLAVETYGGAYDITPWQDITRTDDAQQAGGPRAMAI